MKKENLPVIIAIVLPVILILAVAASVYIPGIGAKPQYNFIYVQNTWPYAYSYQGSECVIYKNYYEIEGNRLSKKVFTSASTTPRDMNSYDNVYSKPMPSPLDSATYCYGYSRIVKKDAPEIYMYDASTDSARLVTYEEASKFTLVDGVISPDGYTIGTSYQNSGFLELFGGDNGYGIYGMKKNIKVKLSVPQTDQYNSGNFGFLAWINK